MFLKMICLIVWLKFGDLYVNKEKIDPEIGITYDVGEYGHLRFLGLGLDLYQNQIFVFATIFTAIPYYAMQTGQWYSDSLQSRIRKLP